MDHGVCWCFTLVVLFLVVFLLVTRKNVGKVFKNSRFFCYGSEKMSENSHDESIPKCLEKIRNFKILKSLSKSACLV